MATLAHVRIALEDALVTGFGTALAGVSVATTGASFVNPKLTIATATTATLWDDSTDLPATWDVLMVLSDKDANLVLDGTTAAASSVIAMKANLPVLIFSQVTLAYDAADRYSGAAQTIKKVRYRQTSGANATVTVVVLD